MKTYSGSFSRGKREVVVSDALDIHRLRCLDYFTPRFAWGFHGAGPDELAIAILYDHFQSEGGMIGSRVQRLFPAFVESIVSKFGHDQSWSVSEEKIARWITDNDRLRKAAD